MQRMKLSDLTPKQTQELAPLVPTTPETMRQYVSGRRGVSSVRAIAIEKAAKKMGLDIRRETMNDGCAKCEFAKTCRSADRKPK